MNLKASHARGMSPSMEKRIANLREIEAGVRVLRDQAELIEAFKVGTPPWCVEMEVLRQRVLRLTGGGELGAAT